MKIDRPIARVFNVAIYLTLAEERAALKINKEEHLSPTIAGSILEKGAMDQLIGILQVVAGQRAMNFNFD